LLIISSTELLMLMVMEK